MFDLENSRGQSLRRVVILHGDRALHHDRPGIELCAHEMNGGAGNRHAVGKRLLLRVETGEGGEQRRVNIENALREGSDA